MIAKEMMPDFMGEAVSISVYRNRRQYPHFHNNTIETILCLEGSAVVYNMHERHKLMPGDILQTDMYDVHSVAGEEGSIIVSFHFDLSHPAFAEEGYKLLYYVCSSDEALEAQRENMDRLKMMLLSMLVQHVDNPHDEMVIVLARNLLEEVKEHFQYYDHINVDEDMYPAEMKKRFERIMTIMLDRYMEKTTMKEICDIEHISYNYLSRFFKDSSLKTFRNFLHEIRVYHSEHILLSNPDMTVPEVAYAVGFSDPKIYYREFRRKHGHTPHQHRIWYRNYGKDAEENQLLPLEEWGQKIKVLAAERYSEIVCKKITGKY